jgi:peptidoglycan DL-endopeptidase CwlO
MRQVAGVAVVTMLAAAFYAGPGVASGDGGGDEPSAVGTSRIGLLYAPGAGAGAADPSDELAWPMQGGGITGRFGEQRGGHVHAGIDLPRPVGTPIRAAGSGTVVMREVQDGYGNYTCIAHVRITSCYAHQSRFHTKQGAKVERGEVIGYVGDTGTSSTPHLHFEVRRGTQPWGTPVNPARYLPKS